MIFRNDSKDHLKEKVINEALKWDGITFRDIAENYMYIGYDHTIVVDIPDHILVMLADKCCWRYKYDLMRYLGGATK